ncbi:MAG: hypothetical protein HQM08_16805 [Candidatus Riflebacteria bacterium]|nr:hypothetical protein [Candidatus Riflebacteria bacterium]
MLKRCFFLAIFCLATLLFPVSGYAESMNQTFDHKLSLGQSSTSWEHRIDLPSDWSAKGLVFNRRILTPSGSLLIEREELSRTYYYVKVRLLKRTFGSSKGSLQVALEAGSPTNPTIFSAPISLAFAGDALNPSFAWNGPGKYFAASLYDRNKNQNLWERVIVGNSSAKLDEGQLEIGGRYILGVCQSDETGKYSSSANKNFRIDGHLETCKHCRGSGQDICSNCNGTGWVNGTGPTPMPCYICNQTGRVPCYICHGTGKVTVPYISDDGN